MTVKIGGARIVHLSISEQYKVGDPPPDGYVQWHEWADVQHKAGLRQRRCSRISFHTWWMSYRHCTSADPESWPR